MRMGMLAHGVTQVGTRIGRGGGGECEAAMGGEGTGEEHTQSHGPPLRVRLLNPYPHTGGDSCVPDIADAWMSGIKSWSEVDGGGGGGREGRAWYTAIAAPSSTAASSS
jgi:hypothetical protein